MRNFLYKIKKSLWPKLAILCYHRVQDYTSDPVKITISDKNFLKQIQYLKNFTEIIHPDQLFDSLINRKSLPNNSVLLTFDDGYSSYEKLMNLLYDESISAIFFISSKKEKYWWDTLSKILLENKSISDKNFKIINSLLSNIGYQFQIEKYVNKLDTLSAWNIGNQNFPFNRNRAFYLIAEKLENLDYYKEKNILETNSNLSNAKRNFSYLSNKKLTKYHRIGYHTINHYNLSRLVYEDQRSEIEIGKKEFESRINKQINIFAYPFGTRNHYNDDTLEIVKNNFSFAFSNTYGLVHKDSNIFELPRFLIRDWPIDEFKQRVKNFFNN